RCGGGSATRGPLPSPPRGRPVSARPRASRPGPLRAGHRGVRRGAPLLRSATRRARAVPADARDGAVEDVHLRFHAGRGGADHRVRARGARAPGVMAGVAAGAFVLFLLLAVPVAFTVGMSAVLGILWSGRYPLTTVLK